MAKPKVLQEIAKVEAIPSGESVQQELVSGTNIKTINESSILGSGDLTIDSGKIDHIQVEGVEQTITEKTVNITKSALGLSQALKFIGISTTEITDQGTEDPTISGTVITTKNTGDVVIYNNTEFVWASAKWNKLGDANSYALSSVTVTGSGALSGGGSLAANREITHTAGNAASVSEGLYKISTDAYSHVNSTTAVQKSDITALGIPSQDTVASEVTFTFAANSATQTISVSGVTADTIGIVAVAQSATQAQYQAAAKAQLRCTAQASGTITMTAYGTTPTVAIPCVLTILKA